VAKDNPANDAPASKEDSAPSAGPLGFVSESKAELAKIIWPGRQQLISESLAVVLIVSLSAGVIYAVNNLFSWVAEIIFKNPV
jgi:preprotein translocase subunit SecE